MKNIKRIISLSLVIIIASVFAACKKNDTTSETTTLNPTLPTATTKESQSGEDASNNAGAGLTMILTTAYGETMPTVVTTLFNLANEISNSIDVNPNLTTGSMIIPDVITSEIPTTETTTELTVPTLAPTEATEPIDTETTAAVEGKETTEEETTKSKEPTLKTVEAGATSISDGKVVIDFDPSDWNGGVKTKKISIITVEYDGRKKSVTGSVIGLSDAADNAQIIINTDDLNIPEGTTANITIPAGSVISKNGDQTSREIVSSVSF